MVVSVKPRLQGGVGPHGQVHPPRYNSQNLVEEWLQKMPTLPTEKLSASDSTALNLSVKPIAAGPTSKSSTCSSQYSKLPISNNGAFNLQNSPPNNMDSNKSRAIRDIQLAHTKDMHGN